MSNELEDAPPRAWMTLKEAADYIRKPPSWLYDNTKKERIPHLRLERQYRFHRESLDQWLLLRLTHGESP